VSGLEGLKKLYSFTAVSRPPVEPK